MEFWSVDVPVGRLGSGIVYRTVVVCGSCYQNCNYGHVFYADQMARGYDGPAPCRCCGQHQ